jgi:serine/threonine protein kinase
VGDRDGPLRGGTANRGRVIRIGDTVHRPQGPQSGAVHQLLNHLATTGFTGAPKLLESRPDTEVLTFIPGVAAYEPMPAWALTDAALASFISLLHDYHRAVETFDGARLNWQRSVPARWRGPLISHNDLNPANVVFRGQEAVALIDFDLAGPGGRAWDLAIAACFWIPLCDDRDVDDSRRGRAFSRFRLLLDAYEASGPLRQETAEALIDANTWISTIIESGARHGHPAFGAIWDASRQRYLRAHPWLVTQQSRLSAV